MEVILAKTAGFCFGVKRAVDTVYKEAGKKNVYTYGPIIHNSEVVNDLKKKGVEVINSREELEALEEGTVIIRSHGVAREIYDLIHEKRLELVDATCPFVRKIHKIVEKAGNDGDQVIIVGSEHHPEVQGIKGWCTGEVHIISDAEQFEGIDLNKPTTLVSQTTFNYKKFQDLVEILNKKGYDIGVCNTICNATEERQLEAKSIAKGVDAMVVIGDKQSSNSQKLYEISKKECENTFFVQTLRDLDLKLFESTGKVGITAGASTPQKIIKEVHASMTEKSFEELLEEKLRKFAMVNEAKTDMEYYIDNNIDLMTEENILMFKIAANSILCCLDSECEADKSRLCDLIGELFINQDFYDLMKDTFPSIKQVVDKLNLPGCIFDIKSVIDWFEECFNTIQTENINYDSMLDYLDKEFDDFNNLYLPDEEEIQIVMN